MAKHKVSFTVPKRPLESVDLEFEVLSDDQKLGELKVSRGGLAWVARNQQRSIHCSWEKFNEFMESIKT